MRASVFRAMDIVPQNNIRAITGWRADKYPISDDKLALTTIRMSMPIKPALYRRMETGSRAMKEVTSIRIGGNIKNLENPA